MIPSIKKILANYSKEDLIDLIERMTERYPDLISLLELSTQKASKPSKSPQPVDLSVYSQQIEKIFRKDDCEDIVDDLEILSQTVTEFVDNQDYLNAGNIYQVLLDGINEGYDEILSQMDYDGEVCCFSQDFAEGLGKCLQLGKDDIDENKKQSWLLTLLDAYFKDVDFGGIDYGFDARNYLLKYSNRQQWQEIEAEIKSRIKSYHGWSRESLVSLLISGKRKKNDSIDEQQLIYEYGTPEQQISLLLEDHKIDEAIAIAKQHFAKYQGQMINFADKLLELNAQEEALKLI